MQPLAGTTILTDIPRPIVAGGHIWTAFVLPPFVTTDATPTTPEFLSFAMAPGTSLSVLVEGYATADDGSMFEYNARNAWVRTLLGVSSRVGTSAGVQTNVGNTFPPPAATRPKVTFNDPAATHTAGPIFTGRDGTEITWLVTAFLQRRDI